MEYVLDFSGRYYAYTDLRWVSHSTTFGTSQGSHSQNAGTGLEPNVHNDTQGHWVKAGEKLKEFLYRMDRNNTQVTAVNLRLVHLAIDGTETVLHAIDALGITSLARDTMAVLDLTDDNILMPSDGILAVAMQPIGVMTSTRYILTSIQARMEMNAGQNNGDNAMSTFETAMRAGNAWSSGTGIHKMKQLQVLNQVFTNPSDSGVDAYINKRIFGGNRISKARPLKCGFIINPQPIFGGQIASTNNLVTGGSNSVMELSFKLEETPLESVDDLTNPLGFNIPDGANAYVIDSPRIVKPGSSIGFFVVGDFQETKQDEVGITYVWHEEPTT